MMLKRHVTLCELVKTVFQFAMLCFSDRVVCTVILRPVLPRGPGCLTQSVHFESNHVSLNEAMTAPCTTMDSHVSMTTHHQFSNVVEMLRDGVHLSD